MLAAGLGSGVLLRSLNLSGILELNLKKAGLLALPPQIGELSQLTKLDVSLSPLSDLPEAIGKLSQLRILFCLGCRFGSVPIVLGTLPALYMLSFKSNKLTSISPAALAPTLEWLILTDNQLTTLPSQLPKGLRKVMLTNNKLRQLPEALVACADLELIRLADNALERLPAGMLTMPKLSWMGLAGNPLLARGGAGFAPLPAPRWVHPDELSFHEQLGAGGGGFVHRATWTCAPGATPVACAVKVFRGAASVTDGDPAHEIDLGEALSHPNVIRVLGACPAPQLGLVLELLEPGEWTELGLPPSFATCTRDTYKAGTAFSLAQVLTTLQGVAAACAHLHAKRFTHGDLYAHNTMIQPRTGEAKVGDFGAAYNYEPLGPSSAPLIERIEVRAFGCMAEELAQRVGLEGTGPIHSASIAAKLTKLTKLIEQCMRPDVAARPSFAAIVATLADI
ncbi:serine threonine protein kinase [Chrysochromulina tobinii]|uniref:Serine threonine protein kinase n=1 Tax=Chrysochromulina tobinii TaxID=1460289 RepID=A0A0M0JNL6_9EUKA|nr:serine threonine protein kinase [Chrysochromulina tobinii]|eukprot:KOO27853.1 serine threonine protein kinase [Chrysochromulina sp. CCMP291]